MGILPELQHREPNHPRGTRPWARVHFVPVRVHASQPGAAPGLQHAPCSAYDCRDPGESASTRAAPTFQGFLATRKSLNVLLCTAKLISCLRATCPRRGKALASSSSPAGAILSQGDSRRCQTQAASSVSCPHPQHRGYSKVFHSRARPELHLPLS